VIFVLLQTGALQSLMGVDEFVLPRPSSIGSIISATCPRSSQCPGNADCLSRRACARFSFGYLMRSWQPFYKMGAGGLSIVAAFNAIRLSRWLR
jgi:hypothetical protein